MGRLNHENNVAIPGYGKPVLLSGDDSFIKQPGPVAGLRLHRQLRRCRAGTTQGTLCAFVPDEAGDQRLLRLRASSSTTSISGHFIPVPEGDRYRARMPTGTTSRRPTSRGRWLRTPRRRPTGTWQRAPGRQHRPRHRRPAVGPRALGRHAQRLPVPAHRGHRLRQAAGHVQRRLPGRLRPRDFAPTSRLGPAAPSRSTNGRIWKMVLDPTTRRSSQSLSILIDGDDNPVKTVGEIHQPDNLETTLNGLYITEDPGSSQQFDAAQQVRTPRAPRPPGCGSTSSADGGARRRRGQGRPVGRRGPDATWTPPRRPAAGANGSPRASSTCRRSSVPASSSSTSRPTRCASRQQAATSWTNKREGGQLLLVTIPGG